MRELFLNTDPYSYFGNNYSPAYILYQYSTSSDTKNNYFYYRYYHKISSSSYKRILITRTKSKSDPLGDATFTLTQEASLTSPAYTYKRGNSGKIILSAQPNVFSNSWLSDTSDTNGMLIYWSAVNEISVIMNFYTSASDPAIIKFTFPTDYNNNSPVFSLHGYDDVLNNLGDKCKIYLWSNAVG